MAAEVLASNIDGHGLITAQHVHLPPDRLSTLITQGTAEEFNARKHLEYQKTYWHTLTELGLSPSATDNKNKAPPILDLAFTEPFRLLSDAGVEAMRRAVFSEEVFSNCLFKVKDVGGADFTHWDLRNTSKHSKFIKDFWKSPSVSQVLVDAMDGYAIIPTCDVEIGHVNLLTPAMDKVERGVTGWHMDENCQFVCILMLNDAKNMVGGETAVMRGDGSVALIKYPAAGYAIMMQGLNIAHAVTNVLSSAGERMTMVTSYQPADYREPQNGLIKSYLPLGTDDDRRQMCAEYAKWRIDVLSKRMADLAVEVDSDRKVGKFDLAKLRKEAASLSIFLDITLEQVTPDDLPST